MGSGYGAGDAEVSEDEGSVFVTCMKTGNNGM